MLGVLRSSTRGCEQGKEQADTGNYKRKVRLLLNIQHVTPGGAGFPARPAEITQDCLFAIPSACP